MDDAQPLIPVVPPNVPRVRANAFTRWVGRSVLRLGGWRVAGTIPDCSKLVLIVAPHSSNWDGLWGFAAKLAMGLEIRVLGKRQLFWWPLGPLLRRLGVIPIDRSVSQGTVGQVVEMMVRADHLWFAVTPEGTRKQVKKWKTGFWKIAHAARVPILPAYFHYPNKTIGLGELFHASDDANADIARLREWYQPWMGRNRGTV
ncbi:lysophospholipid acyltransferase family protein [Luteimonas sp. LNNU 24178]|uniref:lysophospholipid acyltransferase family protein n=1 Tax=Luteimonas suaedae TaxID=2605430 RepID=UPI0011EF8BDA